MKWLFEAKQGEVSPLYECGNNDHLLVIALTAVHPQGYRSWDDPQVKEILKREVIKDKKAEKLMEEYNTKAKSVGQKAGSEKTFSFLYTSADRTRIFAKSSFVGSICADASWHVPQLRRSRRPPST